MKKIEILAPAGSFDSVIAAVRSGADAVYLGEKAFSARSSAKNFDDEELKKATAYCHIHGVKVYVTINTIVFDDELEKLKKAIISAAEADVDALIVQNMGVARLAHRLVPDLALHASMLPQRNDRRKERKPWFLCPAVPTAVFRKQSKGRSCFKS